MSDEVPVTETLKEMIAEVDRLKLMLAKMEREKVLAHAEKALAQNEAAEAKYKCTVLEVYLKYGLSLQDQLNEDGSIKRISK